MLSSMRRCRADCLRHCLSSVSHYSDSSRCLGDQHIVTCIINSLVTQLVQDFETIECRLWNYISQRIISLKLP